MRIVLDTEDYKNLPVTVDSEILGGRPVFSGTRVPLDALWNNLADGATLEEFLEWFPTVSREQAEAILRFGYRSLADVA
jgi:uncharacterized protein (DUF433 family)